MRPLVLLFCLCLATVAHGQTPAEARAHLLTALSTYFNTEAKGTESDGFRLLDAHAEPDKIGLRYEVKAFAVRLFNEVEEAGLSREEHRARIRGWFVNMACRDTLIGARLFPLGATFEVQVITLDGVEVGLFPISTCDGTGES